MNEGYILKIKFILGLLDKSSIVNWAETLIRKGDASEEILDLSSNKNSSNEIVSLLNKLSAKEQIDSHRIKEYFYSFFMDNLKGSEVNMEQVESMLVDFYFATKDELFYDENEKLSYSIIQNDLELRKSNKGFQVNLQDLQDFLRFQKEIN